jgi:hypothetical protein
MSTLNLCYDHLVAPGIGYPNLSRHQAQPFTLAWRQFDHHWPRTVPLRLLLYLQRYDIEHSVICTQDDFDFAWYPIGIGWFDHDLDYVSLLSDRVRRLLCRGTSRVLFYYHEGDDPAKIRDRLDWLFVHHGLPTTAYVFVSANSAAQHLDRFIYFPDHESFFSYVNREQPPSVPICEKKSYTFTAINRTPKSWRVAIMADLHRRGYLDQAAWSLDTAIESDVADENPIEIDSDPVWRQAAQQFRSKGPYIIDTSEDKQRNDHHWINELLYRDAYFHLVLETHFDADQSGGTFLTEKTFKCLKYGQPFFLAAPAGSLRDLKKMGYDVYDQYMDISYDDIIDNTQRWHRLRESLEIVLSGDLHSWYRSCIDVSKHNQEVFCKRSHQAIKSLLQNLAAHSKPI